MLPENCLPPAVSSDSGLCTHTHTRTHTGLLAHGYVVGSLHLEGVSSLRRLQNPLSI